MDSFYKVLTPEQSAQARGNNFNFDHPSAFDYDILYETLIKLKKGYTSCEFVHDYPESQWVKEKSTTLKSVDIPVYNFSTHSREAKTKTIYGANVVIFEGIFALYDKRITNLMDLKIFVDTDADIRLARRLKRDITERGRDVQGVLQQYTRFVKPSFDDYIQPTVKNADVIIPRGLENAVAIDLITKHIQRQLKDRLHSLRWDLARTPIGEALPDTLVVLEPTNQIKGMHTILRDQTTSRDNFIFYAERLSTLVIERGLAELPFDDHTVITPTNAEYHGKRLSEQICGVSILRAGGTMETGLLRVCQDARIGKLLIQTDPTSGEPQDATVGTGAAGLMAIRVLLDHDVPAEHIIFLTFLAAPQGIHVIANAFPKVRIVTSMVDPALSPDTLWIEPGLGNFGDRYFGTEAD
ncbi:hypothetical protein BC937DRAFT_91491 [Endogone sp. FLAS-F59071]|nr:hypothetical protein BC937DRAFT_91491 [Endogone sp. FLAS-F59071]|eukprot:RUS16215.1 hypothetical protein BC937DRAFT_91491 [Endogone sp. FLAS-F59071]